MSRKAKQPLSQNLLTHPEVAWEKDGGASRPVRLLFVGRFKADDEFDQVFPGHFHFKADAQRCVCIMTSGCPCQNYMRSISTILISERNWFLALTDRFSLLLLLYLPAGSFSTSQLSQLLPAIRVYYAWNRYYFCLPGCVSPFPFTVAPSFIFLEFGFHVILPRYWNN